MEKDQFDVEALNFPELTNDTPTGNEQAVPTPSVPETPEVKTEVIPEVKPEVKTEPEVKPEEKTETISVSNPPSRYENESDIQFKIRTDIWMVGQAKAQAETPEEKSELAKHIKGLRRELAFNHKSDTVPTAQKIETSQSSVQETKTEEELAKEALRNMGYLSKDEVEAMVQNLVSTTKTQDDHLQATQEFYSTHKDIAANQAQREVLERFVVEKFNITPQSTKQDLLVAMDMARSYLFPKTDTRAQRAAESADKRDLVSFSSNTQSVPVVDKADELTANALKGMGKSMKDMGWDD